METLTYVFDSLSADKGKNYIFQRVYGRKLTDIYHAHDFYELTWFLNGSAVQRLNGREAVLTKDTAVLMRPYDCHSFVSQSDDVDVISLSIKKEELELVAGVYGPFLATLINSECEPIVLENAAAPDTSRLTEGFAEYDCKWLLFSLLHIYVARPQAQRTAVPKKLEGAIALMKREENLKDGISAFCALSGYSQSHLSRLIAQYFGMSLKKYINELRLNSAYGDIVLTGEPIGEIAERVGFLSYSHFNKIFKSRFKLTPSALRKQGGAWTV